MKKKILDFIRGRPAFQPFLEKIHHSLLRAMGIGIGGETETSGEILALGYVREKLARTSRPMLFDVGANVGNYSILLTKMFPDADIFAFEPSPKTFRMLRQKCPSSVKTFKLGFGNRREKATLYTNENNRTLASVYKRNLSGKHSFDETEEIEVDTIDNFCAQNGVIHVDLLKLDVEGNELNCLCGAWQMLGENKISFIQFEFGGCNIDSRTFFKDFYFLLNEQYKIYRIMQHGLCEIKKYSETYELFITANYLAELKRDTKTNLKT